MNSRNRIAAKSSITDRIRYVPSEELSPTETADVASASVSS
jgi:hypothetical protein